MGDTYSEYIILGAGTAGVRCAMDLARQGKSVCVLEADSVPNGRAKSIPLNHSPYATPYRIDLDAHWNHGGEESPFVQWFCNYFSDRIGMFGIKKWNEFFTLDRVDRVFDITKDGMRSGFRLEGGRLIEMLFDAYEKRHPGKDTTLAHLAVGTDNEKLKQHVQFTAATWAGVEGAHNVSAYEYARDPAGSGGYQVIGGMARMQSAMVDDAQSRGVDFVLNCKCISVTQGSDGCIFTDDKGNRFFSSYGGITASIGVLQRDAIAFDAALPAGPNGKAQLYSEIRRYANSLTMGNMTKITVPLDLDFFDNAGIAPNDRFDFRQEHKIFCHAHSAGNPTATIYAGGDLAVRLERLARKSMKDIEDFIDCTLKLIPCFEGFRKYMDAPPHITECNDSEFSFGAYSALKPGRKRRDPMPYGRLVFFGEAFVGDIKNSPGTLAGANYSGGRAAEILLSEMEEHVPEIPAARKIRYDEALAAAAN